VARCMQKVFIFLSKFLIVSGKKYIFAVRIM